MFLLFLLTFWLTIKYEYSYTDSTGKKYYNAKYFCDEDCTGFMYLELYNLQIDYDYDGKCKGGYWGGYWDVVNQCSQKSMTATPPEQTPYTTPFTTPFETPYETPFTTPIETPYKTPLSSPIETPYKTPFKSPLATPYRTPCKSPIATPIRTLQPSQTVPVEVEFVHSRTVVDVTVSFSTISTTTSQTFIRTLSNGIEVEISQIIVLAFSSVYYSISQSETLTYIIFNQEELETGPAIDSTTLIIIIIGAALGVFIVLGVIGLVLHIVLNIFRKKK